MGINVKPLTTKSDSFFVQLKVGNLRIRVEDIIIHLYIHKPYVKTKLQSYLRHAVTGNDDVWSDFVGGGSAASDYTNGASQPFSLTDLKIDDEFIEGASYAEACVMMKGNFNYALDGEACSTEARYVCMKSCK